MILLSDLWQKLTGKSPPVLTTIRLDATPPEDDWERERRRAKQEELEEDYVRRIARLEDQYSVERGSR